MTDMQHAVTDAGLVPEENEKSFDRFQMLEAIQPVFSNKEEFRQELERDKEELSGRKDWWSKILPRFRGIIAEQIELKGTTDPDKRDQVKKNAKRVKYLLYEDEMHAYRGISLTAWTMAFVEYLRAKGNIRSLRARKIFLEKIVPLGFMVEDKQGEIKQFGRRYSLASHIAELTEAAQVVSMIEELIEKAFRLDRTRDRKGLRQWVPVLREKGLSLDNLAAGHSGYSLGFIEFKRGAGQSRDQLPGVIVWKSDGTNIQIDHAFKNPGRYAESRELIGVELQVDWVCSTEPVKGRVRIPDQDTWHKAMDAQKLWAECVGSDQSGLDGYLKKIFGEKDELPKQVESKQEPTAAAATTTPEPVQQTPAEETFLCIYPGCTHEPFTSVQRRNGHMASHSKTKK